MAQFLQTYLCGIFQLEMTEQGILSRKDTCNFELQNAGVGHHDLIGT